MLDVNETIDQRNDTHGDYAIQANLSERLKTLMHFASSWDDLTRSQRQALDMIALKIGRILVGAPNFADHWHDIAGYATLVEKELSDDEPK
jgi:hypothetical protein